MKNDKIVPSVIYRLLFVCFDGGEDECKHFSRMEYYYFIYPEINQQLVSL